MLALPGELALHLIFIIILKEMLTQLSESCRTLWLCAFLPFTATPNISVSNQLRGPLPPPSGSNNEFLPTRHRQGKTIFKTRR